VGAQRAAPRAGHASPYKNRCDCFNFNELRFDAIALPYIMKPLAKPLIQHIQKLIHHSRGFAALDLEFAQRMHLKP